MEIAHKTKGKITPDSITVWPGRSRKSTGTLVFCSGPLPFGKTSSLNPHPNKQINPTAPASKNLVFRPFPEISYLTSGSSADPSACAEKIQDPPAASHEGRGIFATIWGLLNLLFLLDVLHLYLHIDMRMYISQCAMHMFPMRTYSALSGLEAPQVRGRATASAFFSSRFMWFGFV